jgi:hypothetical protein
MTDITQVPGASAASSSTAKIAVGEPLAGMPNGHTEVLAFPPRCASGASYDSSGEQQLIAAAEAALAASSHRVVVLHVVLGSKTGLW